MKTNSRVRPGPGTGAIPRAIATLALATLTIATARAGDPEDAAAKDPVLERLRALPAPERVLENARERARVELENLRASKKPAAVERKPTIQLRNGNIIRGELASRTIALETPFGVLDFPVEQLIEVHFRLRTPPERERAVAAAIEQLGDDDFEKREAATVALRELDLDAVPALRAALKSADEEVRIRAEKLLEELEPLLEEGGTSTPRLAETDRITTSKIAVDGRIATKSFEVATDYGTLEVPRRDIVRIEFETVGPQLAEVTVSHTSTAPTTWVRTSLTLKKGDRLLITAAGTMGVPDYGYHCGPGGISHRSSRVFAGMPEMALIGKIGASGAPFLVGPKYAARSSDRGSLFLAIVPFRYTHYATYGSYEVKAESR